MAAPVNSLEFFSLVEKSQLLEQELVSKLRPQIASQKSADPKKLALTLLKNQLLTEYQARQLLSGKNKGFYLARYKIMELLGSGGMGRVYLAEQLSMERLVAIKLISLQKSKKRQDQALARFKREAKAVAALRHTNIIQAFDYADENGLPYFVMEYVEGIDTARIVHRFGPIHWSQVAEIGRQAAEGLQHAHEAGLVHRDIKPGNLLVDSSGLVKVLDLGLVSAFDQKGDDALTVDQDQLGTVDYIAPEQALDSKSVDARSDLYGLGATLYSIMSGRVLYPDKTTAQKLLLHQTTEPEPISSLVKEIPAELATVIHKMLAKKPVDRFQSAEEVAQALKPFAVPRTPPYDLNAIKYRRSIYEGFLGKSPEPARITVPTLGSPELEKPESTPTRDSSSPSSGQLRRASAINVESSEVVTDDFSSLTDESSQMAMEMPSIVGRKKRKPKKKSGIELTRWIILAGVVVGVVVAAWLGTYAIRAMAVTDDHLAAITSASDPARQVVPVGQAAAVAQPDPPAQSPAVQLPGPMPVIEPAPVAPPMPDAALAVTLQPAVPMEVPDSTTEATPQPPLPAPVSPLRNSPTAELNPQSAGLLSPVSESVWRESHTQVVKDPSLQVCYTFDESTISGKRVKNLAQATSGLFLLELAGPEIELGRFPGKKAMRFNPSAGVQYAELTSSDSNRLQLEGRYTIAIWFKVQSFEKQLQTLISKGANGWQIRKNPDSNALGVQYLEENMKSWQLNGTRAVNDGRWHQIVAVNSAQQSSLYLDGELDSSSEGPTSAARNSRRVRLGGVSDVSRSGHGFNGWIDEVEIWSRDLNSGEIRQLFSQGNPSQ
jgi:serine/threonine protein kinase